MSQDAKQTETIPPEIQEVMRNLVSAIRAVKLYPPNNPIYSQSVSKAFESLKTHLNNLPHFHVGVQKTYFLYGDQPVAKETQINRTIAQDLFAKGIREIAFHAGVDEREVGELFRALALTPEEMGLKNGMVAILWEKDVSHIKVSEAALEEVITTHADGMAASLRNEPPIKVGERAAKRELHFKGRTLILGDLIEDPKAFGSKMLDIAEKTLAEGETLEDRLHSLYQEAGKLISDESDEDKDELFRGLARSIMEMDPEFRNKFISSNLYSHVDSSRLHDAPVDENGTVPSELHEIVTGRFSEEWSIQQIASVLKKSSQQQASGGEPLVLPSELTPVPIEEEIYHIARDLTEYTPEEMEVLRALGEAGTESDVTEAAVRTLLFLLPMVKDPGGPDVPEKDQQLFAGVVKQLEDMLAGLLKQKDYELAQLIVRAFHMPVNPAFQPRLNEALKKASAKPVISEVVGSMRAAQKHSPAYEAAYAYLSAFDQEATAALLDAIATEKDRSTRIYLLEVVKELGRAQLATLAKNLGDSRWYVVRNVVSILAENRSEEILQYLEKVASHKQVQIRQEIIKALLQIGGKKAAVFLSRYLQDKDEDVRVLAIRGLGIIPGGGAEPARALEAFLEGRHLKKSEIEMTVEAIKSLGKAGDRASAAFLGRYNRRLWWKSRKLQDELRRNAADSLRHIERRLSDGGRAA